MSDRIKKELSQLCQKVGTRVPLWTQGAGGNISIKDQASLWIKATGHRLDSVTPTSGIAQVNFRKMAQVLEEARWSEETAEQNYADLIHETTVQGAGLGRASMETGFHARLNSLYVMHFHSLVSLLLSHEFKKNKTKVSSWLKSQTDLSWVMIEPCRPGWVLSKRVSGSSLIYFLECHGIILQGENGDILSKWAEIEKSFCRDFNYHELGEILNSNVEFREMFKEYGLKAIPKRCFFPDIAVFEERLNRCLKKESSGLAFFPIETIETDRDMAELWLATQLLYKFCPQFEEFPFEIARDLKNLPTEKLRRQKELSYGS